MDYSNSFIEVMLSDVNVDISEDVVFDAVRRGYTDLYDASDSDIVDYFADVDADSMSGHVSNIKGIAFEIAEVDAMNNMFADAGLDVSAELFGMTNHAGTDILLSNGQEFSVKSGGSADAALEDMSEGFDVIATGEIAEQCNAINGGVTNVELTADVVDALGGSSVVEVVFEVVTSLLPI